MICKRLRDNNKTTKKFTGEKENFCLEFKTAKSV